MSASARPPAPDGKALLANAVALQEHFSRLLQMPGRLRLPGAAPTLAQRLRLVASPARLTPQQWEEAHAASLRRGDSRCECAVCLQPFRQQPQVLLSCSHVFHQACLASFEAYAGVRSCPLCRCQAYQKRHVQDGARWVLRWQPTGCCPPLLVGPLSATCGRRVCGRPSAPPPPSRFYREACATRIQAAWRDYRARRQFAVLRDQVPPNHPVLRRRCVLVASAGPAVGLASKLH